MTRLTILIVCTLATASYADTHWQPDKSKDQVSSQDAEAYCARLGKGWRLPVKAELQALLVNPDADESAFRADAPALPKLGYLWTGEDVGASRQGQRWIMNLRNGAIFNGEGNKGYAKCVHGDKPAPSDAPLSAPFATIGAPDAKLAIVVAMQADSLWSKVRPMLDTLAHAHKVKFELHIDLTSDRSRPASVAVCAAGLAGKLVEAEKVLANKELVTPAQLRTGVVELGVTETAYDANVKVCNSNIDNDRKAFDKLELAGVPAFIIGKQTIIGAKTLEAAIKQAGQ
jgi:hypothetical protein